MGKVRKLNVDKVEDAEVIDYMDEITRKNFHLMVGCHWVVTAEGMMVNMVNTGEMAVAKNGYHFVLDLEVTPSFIKPQEEGESWIDVLLRDCKPLLLPIEDMPEHDKLLWLEQASTTGMKVTADVIRAQAKGTAWLLMHGYDALGWIVKEIAVLGGLRSIDVDQGKEDQDGNE